VVGNRKGSKPAHKSRTTLIGKDRRNKGGEQERFLGKDREWDRKIVGGGEMISRTMK